MKVFLRIVAGLVGVSVGWAVWLLVVIVRAGLLQFEAALTISVLLLLIAGGSIAAVQLWRLRRTGLTVAVTLCGGVVLSFVLMLVSGSPLTALPGLIVSGGLLAVLLSPAAWRACEER
jgi:phosphatidylserine synthase